jgi:hypothetical protein
MRWTAVQLACRPATAAEKRGEGGKARPFLVLGVFIMAAGLAAACIAAGWLVAPSLARLGPHVRVPSAPAEPSPIVGDHIDALQWSPGGDRLLVAASGATAHSI